MNIDEIIAAIQLRLIEVRSGLTTWFREDASILNYKPKNGGWSGIQILEHITLTSHFLLLIIDKATAKAVRRAVTENIVEDWNNYELIPRALAEVGIHKSFAWIRPEHMEPTGNVSLDDIENMMMEQFDRCDGNLSMLTHGEGILCKTTMTVNGIGKLDVYQYIFFLILHAERHMIQLEVNRREFREF